MEFSRHTYVDIRQSWSLLLNTVIFKELAFSQYIFVQQAEEIQMKLIKDFLWQYFVDFILNLETEET